MTDQRISLKYALITSLIVIITWLVHEFSHWVMGKALGYDSVMYLNAVGTHYSDDSPDWHKNLVSAAGPLITILQAVMVYFILSLKGWSKLIYPLLLTPLYMRLMAGIMNVLSPNDEGAIGQSLGIGLYTLSLIVSGLLFFLVYKITKKYKLSKKFNFWSLLLIIVVSSVIILADMFFRIRLIR